VSPWSGNANLTRSLLRSTIEVTNIKVIINLNLSLSDNEKVNFSFYFLLTELGGGGGVAGHLMKIEKLKTSGLFE
jgi:hypothetical protein